MSFLRGRERFIFMDCELKFEEPKVRLSADNVKKLVDAGINTTMMFHTNWNWIEPTRGVFDWSYYDDRVQLLRDCGMKVLIHSMTWFPEWMPEDWKLRGINASQKVPSPWNAEAWGWVTSRTKAICERYNSQDVMVTNSWLSDGETSFPNEICIYDNAALDQYKTVYGDTPFNYTEGVETFLRKKQITSYAELMAITAQNEHKEIWTSLHPALAYQTGNGCEHIEAILKKVKDTLPDTTINHLYCTWAMWGMYWPTMNRWRDVYCENVFGGAEYAEGLESSCPAAIRNSLRGLLIGPTHPFTNHTDIEPWMTDRIKWAMELWQ